MGEVQTTAVACSGIDSQPDHPESFVQVDGETQLQELLRRPPADVANWVVQQVQHGGLGIWKFCIEITRRVCHSAVCEAQALSSGEPVEQLQIFQVAGRFDSTRFSKEDPNTHLCHVPTTMLPSLNILCLWNSWTKIDHGEIWESKCVV